MNTSVKDVTMNLAIRKRVIKILTPNQLESIPNNIVDLFQELETFVITDFARRLKSTGDITNTAEWQKKQAELTGIKNIENKVASILKLSDEQISFLFPNIALASFKAEMLIYEQAKLNTIDYKSKPIQDYIKVAIKQTKGDIENITQSLGFAEEINGKRVYSDIAKFYQKELNVAHIKIQSGVQDYNSAIKQAVKKMSESGLRYVNYEKGYSNNIDVATRRAILTGTHKMNQEMINNCMNELVSPQEQYAEVSAHANARPSHQVWQGRIFKVNGSDKDHENLAEATDLGSVTGLMGANCRHSYFNFVLGASVRTYTEEQLKNINTPDFEYKGETYTGYKATQQQRKIETAIRQTKRELIGYKESGLTEEFKSTSILLKQQEKEYRDFSEASGIRVKNERKQVEGFNRSLASQATNAAKKGE